MDIHINDNSSFTLTKQGIKGYYAKFDNETVEIKNPCDVPSFTNYRRFKEKVKNNESVFLGDWVRSEDQYNGLYVIFNTAEIKTA